MSWCMARCERRGGRCMLRRINRWRGDRQRRAAGQSPIRPSQACGPVWSGRGRGVVPRRERAVITARALAIRRSPGRSVLRGGFLGCGALNHDSERSCSEAWLAKRQRGTLAWSSIGVLDLKPFGELRLGSSARSRTLAACHLLALWQGAPQERGYVVGKSLGRTDAAFGLLAG